MTGIRIAHFSAGASSAVAAILGRADRLVYAETGAEHPDNQRFIADIERHMGIDVVRLRSEKYADTWDVWERERHRANRLAQHKPDMRCMFPLIDYGISSAGAQQYLIDMGIAPPVTYAMGLKHANCIPCPKASSPGYWALIRDKFPEQFERMAQLEESLLRSVDGKPRDGGRLVRVNGERVTLRKLPADTKPSAAQAPSCDLLCEMAKEKSA